MTPKSLALALMLALPALPAIAMEDVIRHGDLVISGAHTLEMPPNASTAAGYVVIENTGTTDDVLVGVSAGDLTVMLHKTETSADGVARMVHQMMGIPLPAGETVTLEPGGLHIMFMDLPKRFSSDSPPKVSLEFRNAGELEISLDVRARGDSGAGNSHGN